MSKAKTVSKSVRLTDEVYHYINQYQGEGFNNKFENIILNAMCSEPVRIKKIAELDRQIKQREEYIRSLLTRTSALDSLFRDSARLQTALSDLADSFEEMTGKSPAKK